MLNLADFPKKEEADRKMNSSSEANSLSTIAMAGCAFGAIVALDGNAELVDCNEPDTLAPPTEPAVELPVESPEEVAVPLLWL